LSATSTLLIIGSSIVDKFCASALASTNVPSLVLHPNDVQRTSGLEPTGSPGIAIAGHLEGATSPTMQNSNIKRDLAASVTPPRALRHHA
jgi:hypothetical protein